MLPPPRVGSPLMGNAGSASGFFSPEKNTVNLTRSEFGYNIRTNRDNEIIICYRTGQWQIQDFPSVGVPTFQGTSTYIFANFFHKQHDIERIWTPRRWYKSKILLCKSATAGTHSLVLALKSCYNGPPATKTVFLCL